MHCEFVKLDLKQVIMKFAKTLSITFQFFLATSVWLIIPMAMWGNSLPMDTVQLNVPTAPGDSCHSAPLLCGWYLDGYCSRNDTATADIPDNLATASPCTVENNQWLRFHTCDTVIRLVVEVDDCTMGSGLELAVFSADSCRDFQVHGNCYSLLAGNTDTLTINGLVYDSTYYLMLDGIDAATCRYQIKVIDGIGTRPPTYSGSGGGIDGPAEVCLFEEVSYSLTFPDCELVDPGDGCPVPPGNSMADSTLGWQWHIPDGWVFTSDSVNVPEITVIPNDTIDGWIYVTFGNSQPDTLPRDVYCDTGGCIFSGAMFVMVIYDIEYLPPIIICEPECAEFCGEIYCASTTEWCPKECGFQVQEIIVQPKEFFTYQYTVCPGECVSLPWGVFCGGIHYFVDECTDYEIIINEYNVEPIDLGTFMVCEGECMIVNGQTFCSPGTYSVDTTDNHGCLTQAIFDVEFLEVENIDLGIITLCEDECFDFRAVEYCEENTYSIDTFDINGCITQLIFEVVKREPIPLEIGPISKICDASHTSYTVSFYITSGLPPFFIDGMELTDSLFVFGPIASDSSFSFTLTDSDSCSQLLTIDGTHSCLIPCLSNAGSMSSSLLEACEGEEVLAVANTDTVLDEDDVATYILHTSPTAEPGEIIAQSSTATFTFDEQLMDYGVVYYISRVVGNEINGNVDLSDNCLSVAPGQAVVFYMLPEVSLGEAINYLSGVEVELNWQSNSDIQEVEWLIDSEVVSTDEKYVLIPQGEMSVSVVVTDEHGCTAEASVLLSPCPPDAFLYIPNVFTPNADGTNDRFVILGSEKVKEIKRCAVFNRWGALVFEKFNFYPNDRESGWDGHFKGEQAPSDTYIYLVEATLINDRTVLKKGDVTLIR